VKTADSPVSRKMKIQTVLLYIGIVLAGFIFTLVISDRFRNAIIHEVKFRIIYTEYSDWKKNGGPWKMDYGEPLLQDTKRDLMVKGLLESEIKSKFPFLVPGGKFGEGTYKGDYYRAIRGNGVKILWFSASDGFDWVIKLKDGVGESLDLIKG